MIGSQRRHGAGRLLRTGLLAVVAAFSLALTPLPALATDFVELRTGMALEVFPRLLAVDNGLKDKTADNGKLELLLVYSRDHKGAEAYAARLRERVPRVRDFATEVSLADVEAATKYPSVPAAVLLVEPLDKAEFTALARHAVEKKRMLFSPYRGDVERGSAAGLHMGVQVTPWFNTSVLKSAGIRIHPGVLRISKLYEPED